MQIDYCSSREKVAKLQNILTEASSKIKIYSKFSKFRAIYIMIKSESKNIINNNENEDI